MGNFANCFFGRTHGVDDRPGSRWCESRSRPPLGRRSVRLEGPFYGCRQPCRLRCQVWNNVRNDGESFRCGKGSCFLFVLQVSVCCFTSADWYGVWGRFDRVFSDRFILFSVCLVKGSRDDGLFEESSDDGSFVFIIKGAQNLVLGSSRFYLGVVVFRRLAVNWRWLNGDDGSVVRFACVCFVLGMGSLAFTFNIGLSCRWRSEGSQSFFGLKIGEGLEDGWFVVYKAVVIWAWSWWRYRKEKTYLSIRWLSVKVGSTDKLKGWFLEFNGVSLLVLEVAQQWDYGWCVVGFVNRVEGLAVDGLNFDGDQRFVERGIGGWSGFIIPDVVEGEAKALDGGHGVYQGGQRRSQRGEERVEGLLVYGFGFLSTVEGGLSFNLSSDGVQKFDALKIGGWLGSGIPDVQEGGVWFWWIESLRSEEIIIWILWSECLRMGGAAGGLQWFSFWVWLVERMSSRWWSWRSPRWSTAESKGRGKGARDFVGNVNCGCMVRRDRVCTWYFMRGKLGPTRWLFSRDVLQWGTFPWMCEVAGSDGGPRLTCGNQGGFLLKATLVDRKCDFGIRSGGLKWSVLEGCVNEVKWGILSNRSIALKRNVFGSYHNGVIRVWGIVSAEMERCVLDSDSMGVKRCVLKSAAVIMERCILGSQSNGSKCVDLYVIFSLKRCVLGFDSDLILYLENEEILETADEVANLMNNLRFSEEELVEMEGMESQCKEQQCGTEKWVVAKLFTIRKVDGAAVEHCVSKLAGEEGPFQFGEWLRVPLVKKKSSFQSGKKQGIVYIVRRMGESGSSSRRGKNLGMMHQIDDNGEGRGQQLNFAQLRPRGPKRVLQGKYEVCTPVGPKKARSASSSQGIEVEGCSEVVSPLKISITVEAAGQPHREP
ncbi:hypothetical protein V6N11_056284 [Hibiscus sabdariffa]|uniref:Uncharacterized protein n=1 Tax=Hibiscus sabdariffa TaxID=183260 RepID=A0ABR2T3Z6_9ROSI